MLRLAHREKTPVNIGIVPCCTLNETLENVNGHYQSDWTIKGIDNSGAAMVECTFYIVVGERKFEFSYK